MSSPEYQKLVTSLLALKADLMGFKPNPDGNYSKTELLMCQAFVVFSHAEIQVYWESIARRILTEADRRWQANRAGSGNLNNWDKCNFCLTAA
jgi:hypothetical protein